MRARSTLSATFLGLLAFASAVRSSEYRAVVLPLVPDAFSTIPTAFNDAGTVVGQAFVDSPPGLVGWQWTAAGGLEVLPTPPGLVSFRAIDVSNGGIIVGDGGIDWGEAWLYDGLDFEMLGSFPGDTMSLVAGVNEAREVAGTSLSPGATTPRTSFLADGDGVLHPVSSSSWATDLNDSGQVVGYYTSQRAFRFTPGLGVETLPVLEDRLLSWASGINSAGAVVGGTAFATGNGLVPFLYTDEAGMQPIGNFVDGASAYSINDRGQVVGQLSAGGDYPWIWDAQHGVRFLADLIEPTEEIRLLSVSRINGRGAILGVGFDPQTFVRYPVVLEPVGLFADGFESGDLAAWSSSE